MIHVGVLGYSGSRYLWWALVMVVASVALYATQGGGAQPPNGGTWQGYVLGTAGALLIVWLALLGVRKRRYASTLGSVQGWTSAHVYLGSALLVVATLHSAAQVGWNVHTLAYVLMCAVIFSGFYGIFTYVNHPHLISANRAGLSRAELFAELYELDKRGRELAAKAPHEVNVAATSSIERTAIGGGLIAQLFGRDKSQFVTSADSSDDEGGAGGPAGNRDQQAVIDFIAERIPRTNKIAEAELLQELLAVSCRRQAILRRIARDIRLQGWLRVWLFVHIPLTIVLLIALVIHIVTTFLYW